MHSGPKKEEILNAVKMAGCEIIEKGKISSEVNSVISHQLDDTNILVEKMNSIWRDCQEYKIAIDEWTDKVSLFRPSSIPGFLKMMEDAINIKVACDVRLSVNFNFNGEITGRCQITVFDGMIKTSQEVIEKADISIETPFELWVDIVHGRLSAQKMLIQKKFRFEGEYDCLAKVIKLFDFKSYKNSFLLERVKI